MEINGKHTSGTKAAKEVDSCSIAFFSLHLTVQLYRMCDQMFEE